MSHRAALLALVTFFTAPATEAVADRDPTPPTGGFTIQEDIDVPYAWSDGYQVLMDVRYPIDAPGACGWPLVVLVHGGGGDKGVVANTAANLSRMGYLTLAYDVRGQGPSAAANPPTLMHDYVGVRELIDLFEAMEAVESIYPALVDFDRIGVTGYSQGGGHSWWAAMHSGQNPPPNPWRTRAFPEVSAVVVKDNSAGSSFAGTTFRDRVVQKLFSSTGTKYQPAVTAILKALVLAEDYAGFAAAVTAPGMDASVLLPQTTVPVFAHASFDDKRVNPSGVANSWTQLPTGTPKRLQLGTSGHDSPQNDRDRALYQQTRRQWFDRFLKNDQNGVDLLPRVFNGVTPDDVAAYQSEQTLWDFRDHEDLPAPEITTTRAYLAAGGMMFETAAALASTSAVTHAVPAGFYIGVYTNVLTNASALQTAIPLSTLAYDSAILTEDLHLEGAAEVVLSVDTLDPDYQLHAVVFDVGPGGQARFVTSGAASTLGTSGTNTISIRPYIQSYVFRAGHRIRMQLENLVIHRPPTGAASELKNVPYFSSSTVHVAEGGATPSYIDLPVLPFAEPTLSTYPLQQSVSAAENQRLTIHSHSGSAGALYLVLPSLSGTAETIFLGAPVPLQFDALTNLILANPATPPFVQLLGNLDGVGSQDAGVLLGGLPLPPVLIGFELSMAAVVVDGGLVATNAVTIPFVP